MVYRPIPPHSPAAYNEICGYNHSWEDQNLDYLRTAIRTHLNKEFDNSCFYCKSELRQGNSRAHIEHILHKDKYSEYAYRPENLTLSCEECNKSKGIQDALVIQRPNNIYDHYPMNKDDYKIIHAYFDHYEDHIEIDELIYRVKQGSNKGKYTYLMCSLYRLRLAEDKAKMMLKQADQLKVLTRQINQGISDEEIADNIVTLLSLPNNFEQYFAKVIELCSDDTPLRISKRLINIELNDLSEEEFLRMCSIYSRREEFRKYTELVRYIKNNNNLKNTFINYLRQMGILNFDPNVTDFNFGPNTIHEIYRAISTEALKIHGRVKPTIKRLFDDVMTCQNIDEFIGISGIANELSNTCATFLALLSDKISKKMISTLPDRVITKIKMNLADLEGRFEENPQVNVLHKLDLIKNIMNTFQNEELKRLKSHFKEHI